MKITCRICRIQQGEFFTLDSEVPIYGQERKLLEIFNKCVQLNAALQDPLPQVVCLACLDKLTEFYEFQLRAEKSDFELREIIREKHFINNKNIESIIENTSLIAEKSYLDLKTDNQELNVIADDENDFCDEEVSYKEDEENLPEDDEEDVEDTDILFELYSKNDSGLDNCTKFENNNDSSQDTELTEYNSQESKTEINRTDQIISPVTIKEENNDNTILNNSENTTERDEQHTIEISRIKLAGQNIDKQIVMLEPLIEVRKWQCPDCGRKYLTEEKLEQHRRLHKTSDFCQCEVCGKRNIQIFVF